jgi:E3 ubiquitin-protein ligase SHPRH
MIENDAKALGNAPDASEIIKQGLAARNALIPRGGYQQWDSLVTVLNSFKAKVRQLEYTVDTQGTAAKLELKVARKAMFQLQKQTTPQVKCCEALNSELELVVETLNARLLYYKQLQSISDGLTAFTVIKGAKDDAQMEEDLNRALGRGKEYELEESDISDEERAFRINAATMRLAEDVKQREISINKTRTRISYLTYLGSAKGKEKETCTICISDFDRGAMTICGHIFCRDCFKEWFRQHRACPLCKKVLDRNSFHSITLKQLSSFTKTGDLRETTIASPLTNDHHQSLTSEQLCAIDSVKLVHSYSSKIDTIVKHIMSLPKQAKTILYSNWIEVLTFFARALEENGIMSSLLGQKPKKGQHEGLDAFMQNPDCQVLLMSGKSQSAGLTLVNASSLFLVEPLLNHAVERQIVSRIHRIGQTQETSVFQYAVEGTMEMTILKENARLHRAVADKPVYQEEGESDLNILGSKQYAGRLRAGELTDEDETIALFRSNLVLQSASDRGAQETLVGRI